MQIYSVSVISAYRLPRSQLKTLLRHLSFVICLLNWLFSDYRKQEPSRSAGHFKCRATQKLGSSIVFYYKRKNLVEVQLYKKCSSLLEGCENAFVKRRESPRRASSRESSFPSPSPSPRQTLHIKQDGGSIEGNWTKYGSVHYP